MKIQYKKKITAFLDVLGFSDIVMSSDQTLIDMYFSYLKSSILEISDRTNVEFYYISDSIIITAPDSRENLFKVIESIRWIQSALLGNGILLRGAISVGDLHLSKIDNIIVGPSLVNSYKLEGLAKFPRVIVDRQLIQYFGFENTSLFITYFNKPYDSIDTHEQISIDSDDFIFVNYISHVCTRRQNFTTKGILDNVHKLVQKAYFKNVQLEKYAWLVKKILNQLEKQQELMDNLVPIGRGARGQRYTFRKHLPIWIKKFKEI